MNQEVLVRLNVPLPSADRESTISILTLEGLANTRLHRFSEAKQKLEQAAAMCASPQEAECGAVLRAHGLMALEQDHFVEAEQYLEKTLDFARKHKDEFLESTALLNLGAVALYESHFDEAIDWSQSALNLASALGARDIIQVALGNLGWAYYRLGDPEKALDKFGQAIAAATQLSDDFNHLRWIATSGYAYLDLGDYSGAERAYSQALTLANKINSKADVLNAMIALGLVSEQTGRLDQANQYAEQAIAMASADGNRLDELYPLLVEGRVAARRRDNVRAESIFREVADDSKSDVSLKWEAEHALAQLYEGENRAPDAEREYRAALKTFEAARSELKHEESELPFLTNASHIYDDYVHFLVASGRTDEALRVADFTRARTLAEGLGLLRKGVSAGPNSLNAPALARLTGSAILFYWLGEKQSYLWAITARKTELFTLPSSDEINGAVQRYKKALLGPQDVLEMVNRDGAWLYQHLVAPASALIPMNSKVVIIPDRSLNGLNFETLLVSRSRPHYWIEDATISNAGSMMLLGHGYKDGNKRGKLLIFGDPLPAEHEYGVLQNASTEIASIEKHFTPDQITIYAREKATPEAYVESHPDQFSYLHFVAHGTASRTSPLDSAVVLSPGTNQPDSFKLYARDVIRFPLHAQLVTISSCYGAGTRAYAGEGLVGLSWAFLRSGAHNVVGALWDVNDVSTPQLMDRFYGELSAGKGPDVALRDAKLSFVHSTDVWHKPYYWAPFQLYTGE